MAKARATARQNLRRTVNLSQRQGVTTRFSYLVVAKSSCLLRGYQRVSADEELYKSIPRGARESLAYD